MSELPLVPRPTLVGLEVPSPVEVAVIVVVGLVMLGIVGVQGDRIAAD
jgi:hypothetical protein